MWEKGKPARSRLPITPTILRKLKAIWLGGNNISFNDRMLWAASLTTFFSFCHSGKVTVENEANYDCNTHISFSDLAVDNAASPSVISLNIKCSKTDQGRVGCQVVLGKTGDDLCPIVALLDYLARRGDKPGALFQWQDQTPLSKTRFVEAVRQALTAAHLPAQVMQATALGLGQQPRQLWRDWKTRQFRLWEDGKVLHTNCISGWILASWQLCPPPCHHVTCESLYIVIVTALVANNVS